MNSSSALSVSLALWILQFGAVGMAEIRAQKEESPPPIAAPEKSESTIKNEEGVAHFEKKRFAKAAAAFEAALDSLARAKKPVDPTILANLVSARVAVVQDLVGKKELHRAERLLTDTLRRAPKNGQVETWLGVVYYRRGLWRAASDHLLDAILHDPKRATAHFFLGLVEYKQERLQSAIDRWEAAIRLEPDRKKSIAPWLTKAKKELRVERSMQRESSTHFVAKFGLDRDRDISRLVLQDLEEIYRELGQLFDLYPSDPLTVVIYSDREFDAATSAQNWVAALFDGKIRLPVKNFHRRREQLRRTLRHEYTHFLVSKLSRRCPAWINEGLAQKNEGLGIQGLRAQLATVSVRGGLLKDSELQKSFASLSDARRVRLAYQQSLWMVDSLIERSSYREVVGFVKRLDRAKSFSDQFERSFRMTPQAFRRLWVEGLSD